MPRLTIDGYGQVELNNVAFRRDGRIEAQCAPDTADFSTDKVENGMILTVDNIKRQVRYYAGEEDFPVALVYSAEHIYDERTPGLKNFALNGQNDFLPRLGYLAVGDKFTTNCIAYDSAEFANDSALISALDSYATATLYGVVNSAEKGAIAITSTKPTDSPVLFLVTKKTTMPDGQLGVKLQVIAD